MLPNVPTSGELALFSNNEPSWFGLVAPAATPPTAVRRLQQTVVTAVREPALRDRLIAQGLFPSGSTPDEFGAQIGKEIEKMQKVSKFAKIMLD